MQICYNFIHETTWKFNNIRATAAASHRIVAAWLYISQCSQAAWRLVKLRRSMGSKLSPCWASWFGVPSNTRSALPTEQPPTGSTWQSADARRAGCGISQRIVDAETNRQGRGEKLWRELLRVGRLAITKRRFTLERSEARTTRHTARRSGHRALETLCLAAYKKTLGSIVHIWHSLTKADSCLFLPFDEHGHRSGKRQFCGTVTGVIASRLFRASSCRLDATAWLCMRNFIGIILPEWKWLPFCASCRNNFADRLNWYGMAGQFIDAAWWATFCATILKLMSIDFLLTLPKLILTNTSGDKPSNSLQTQRRLTSIISIMACAIRSKRLGVPKVCCGLVSIMPIYLGVNVSII